MTEPVMRWHSYVIDFTGGWSSGKPHSKVGRLDWNWAVALGGLAWAARQIVEELAFS
jgi:hypothetical protein